MSSADAGSSDWGIDGVRTWENLRSELIWPGMENTIWSWVAQVEDRHG